MLLSFIVNTFDDLFLSLLQSETFSPSFISSFEQWLWESRRKFHLPKGASGAEKKNEAEVSKRQWKWGFVCQWCKSPWKHRKFQRLKKSFLFEKVASTSKVRRIDNKRISFSLSLILRNSSKELFVKISNMMSRWSQLISKRETINLHEFNKSTYQADIICNCVQTKNFSR